MNLLSQNLHRCIRQHICRGKYKESVRPVLVNSWEASYFDFDVIPYTNWQKRQSMQALTCWCWMTAGLENVMMITAVSGTGLSMRKMLGGHTGRSDKKINDLGVKLRNLGGAGDDLGRQ